MKTYSNESGSKKVNVTYNEFNGFRASFVQVYNSQESIIMAKSFSNDKKAESWALKNLS